ncbi:DUF3037 domain-containing protein [Pantanalinema sp. GBBB05]|uniref:DUF3037 domain-containing protein n=1 Tax=Pantanalinema sp. GBBB05 TaxID=2604139 RepID=UPI001DF885D8|nr:DUF3037 domain-containing protein [Pantanalinema sp. GBBB05]
MLDPVTYDYAIIRVVPKVEREEFINVGAIVSCPTRQFLKAQIELNQARLITLDATLDIAVIRDYLATIPLICRGGEDAGPIGQLPQRERFHWLVAPRSTIIQTSRVHTGICQQLDRALERLVETMVRPTCATPYPVEPRTKRIVEPPHIGGEEPEC